MSTCTPVTVMPSSLLNLGTLSELLELLAKLSELNEPLNTPDGLRSAIDILLQLGNTIGLDSDWLAWLNSTLENPAIFDVVLAAVNYLLSVIEPAQSTPAANGKTKNAIAKANPQTISVSTWLTLIIGIVQLLQKVLVV